jgi:hypothetical protein
MDYFGGFEQEDPNQLFEAMQSNYKAWVSGFATMASRSRHRLLGRPGVRSNVVQHPTRHRLQRGENYLPKRHAVDATEGDSPMSHPAKQQGLGGAGCGGGLLALLPRWPHDRRSVTDGGPLAAAQLPRHRQPCAETPHRWKFVRIVEALNLLATRSPGELSASTFRLTYR